MINEGTNNILHNQYYEFEKIGEQEWMVENLNVDFFNNGDPIPEASSDVEWKKAGEEQRPAWCYYDNDPENGQKYGKLYNWFAINDKRGLAPEGWHIPSDNDWKILIDYLGGKNIACSKIKAVSGWEVNNGNNESRFNALPGGYLVLNNGDKYQFSQIGYNGFWWTSTEYFIGNNAWCWFISYKGISNSNSYNKICGFSVRCIKD